MLEHLGLAHRKGLSDYLTDDTPISELLIKPSRVEHLVILPGGRPLINSAEMLNSPKMAQLVKDMKSRYHSRIIIFDLPPVLSSADALAFSPYVDAALLVIEEGVTQKHEVEHAVDLLSTTNIIGTVLNKAELKSA
jgi:Mrp family chromosome partitioning ATPase